MNRPFFSVIVPVYNRPHEVSELLESLVKQTYPNFEVLIIEDGSTVLCEQVANQFKGILDIQYYYKINTGPGPSRNYGYARAKGIFFVVFDSDCIIPPSYFESVVKSIEQFHWDAWGGPDRAHENFTLLQRAMGYTMSSILTTGGIRGGKKSVGWFQPRSFNMGISRKVYEVTNGFKFDRFAEDIEFSIRMKKHNFKVGLVPEAYVYHKRRTNFTQFFHQVFNFGRGRALVGTVHPEEIKITHWFPTIFLLGCFTILFLPFLSISMFALALGGLIFYLLAILLHSLYQNKNFKVALLSVPSAILQLSGYGLGFLTETAKSYVGRSSSKN